MEPTTSAESSTTGRTYGPLAIRTDLIENEHPANFLEKGIPTDF